MGCAAKGASVIGVSSVCIRVHASASYFHEWLLIKKILSFSSVNRVTIVFLSVSRTFGHVSPQLLRRRNISPEHPKFYDSGRWVHESLVCMLVSFWIARGGCPLRPPDVPPRWLRWARRW